MTEVGLTQDQIDSMLGSDAAAGPQDVTSDDLNSLTDFERQMMANLPSVLNAMTGAEYEITDVEYAKTKPDEIATLLGDDIIFGITINVGENLKHFIVVERAFAKAIAAALTGGESDDSAELGEMQMSTIQEVISQANGSYLANISSALKIDAVGEAVGVLNAAAAAAEIDAAPLLGTLTLQSGESASVQLKHLIPGKLGDIILKQVRPAAEPAPVAAPAPAPPAAPPQPAAAASAPAPSPAGAQPTGTAPQSAPAGMPQVSSGNIMSGVTEFQQATFSQLAPPSMQLDARNLDILLDVPLTVTVELGKTQIPIRQILEYGQGSLITLDKLAGEPIDLLVNGKYFAKGEVVVIDENFGVRITSILSPAERIAQLT